METVSVGSPSILTDSLQFHTFTMIYYAACAHKDMFHTKLPAVERSFIKYNIYIGLVPVGNVFQEVFS